MTSQLPRQLPSVTEEGIAEFLRRQESEQKSWEHRQRLPPLDLPPTRRVVFQPVIEFERCRYQVDGNGLCGQATNRGLLCDNHRQLIRTHIQEETECESTEEEVESDGEIERKRCQRLAADLEESEPDEGMTL